MISFLKALYLGHRFYLYLAAVMALSLISFVIKPLFILLQIVVFIYFALLIADIYFLWFLRKDYIQAKRSIRERLSNGDLNLAKITVTQEHIYPALVEVVDELPAEFQVRDLKFTKVLDVLTDGVFKYTIQPYKRGEYQLGYINVFFNGPLQIFKRRFIFEEEKVVKVYPSYEQLNHFEFLASSNQLQQLGIKRQPRLGDSQEFDQIKKYTVGDDVRHINWIATARSNDLMVNTYQEERAQNVISIIDKGRSMRSPFNKMTLMDYAINSTLVLSHVALSKDDRVGLITFDKNVETVIPPSKAKGTINLVNEYLYKEDTHFLESSIDDLIPILQKKVNKRSLVLLYTNFESMASLRRSLTALRIIAKSHALVVIFFRNTEVQEMRNDKAEKIKDIYTKAMAEKFLLDKEQIVSELRAVGVMSVLTEPENLSVNTINAYLEVKNRGLI